MSTNITDVPHADTRQGRQAKVALAIAKVCEHQLPEIAHWLIGHDMTVTGKLSAIVHRAPLAALEEWADFFARDGVRPQIDLVPVDEHGDRVQFVAMRGEVQFRISYDVWNRFDESAGAAGRQP